MKAQRDFKPTTKILASLRQEHGRRNSSIPKNESMRQGPFDEALRAESEWMSQNWRTYFSQPSSSSLPSQNWWQHEHQDSQWRERQDHQWQDHKWRKEWRLQTLCKTCGTHFARFLRIRRFFKEFRLQAVAKLCKRLGGEDRTLRPTHIFLSLVSVPHLIALFTRTCARVAQGLKAHDMIGTCCILRAF